MKKKSPDQRDWHERRIEDEREKTGAHPRKQQEGTNSGGQPESAASRNTFPKRTAKPGDTGLANEARPGLGSRADDADPAEAPDVSAPRKKDRSKPEATPRGYEEPRPEPREQSPDSLAHEQERSTGVSGHSGST
jgi:hypothetical protein